MILGAHVSASGGPYKAVARAVLDECECMQIFTKNSNRWSQRMWTEKEARKFRDAMANSPLHTVVSHAAYLINLCSANPTTRTKSVDALLDELIRCQILGIPYLVLHPGAPGDNGEEWGLEQIVNSINELYNAHGEEWPNVTLLFENMAGQGSTLGNAFEHLRYLLANVNARERFGVCFDTCHAHAAGYDITSEEGYTATLDQFDDLVGLDQIKVFHLNDSKKPCGAHVDRHENINEGTIGLETFRWIVNDRRFADRIGVLETPFAEGDRPNYENLRKLKGVREAHGTESD